MGTTGSKYGIQNKVTNETVKSLDPTKYQGTWYEIARYPNVWETGRCDRAIAIYEWNEESQKMRVMNRCIANNQIVNDGYAWAKIPDMNDPGKFKIQFDGMPFVGDYWVRWTDYNNAIVGNGEGDNLWWLSRNPTVKASEVEPMLTRIRKFGYNTDHMVADPSAVTN